MRARAPWTTTTPRRRRDRSAASTRRSATTAPRRRREHSAQAKTIGGISRAPVPATTYSRSGARRSRGSSNKFAKKHERWVSASSTRRRSRRRAGAAPGTVVITRAASTGATPPVANLGINGKGASVARRRCYSSTASSRRAGGRSNPNMTMALPRGRTGTAARWPADVAETRPCISRARPGPGRAGTRRRGRSSR